MSIIKKYFDIDDISLSNQLCYDSDTFIHFKESQKYHFYLPIHFLKMGLISVGSHNQREVNQKTIRLNQISGQKSSYILLIVQECTPHNKGQLIYKCPFSSNLPKDQLIWISALASTSLYKSNIKKSL